MKAGGTATWRIFVVFALTAALWSIAVRADDMRPPEGDHSGKGAVLCVWWIFLAIQASPRVCEWQRQPVDDTIDKAVGDIDEFIIANASQHPDREALEKTKRSMIESILRDPAGTRETCKPFGFADRMRRFTSPDGIARITSDLLSIPREPRMNPCL
jgi:hypothetical protein